MLDYIAFLTYSVGGSCGSSVSGYIERKAYTLINYDQKDIAYHSDAKANAYAYVNACVNAYINAYARYLFVSCGCNGTDRKTYVCDSSYK